MGKLVEVVKLVEARLNPDLKITGIVICMYRSQTTLAREVLNEVNSFFGDIVFESKIRQNIKLAEAPGHGKTIFEYDPTSNGAIDYKELTREVVGEKVMIPEDPSMKEEETRPAIEHNSLEDGTLESEPLEDKADSPDRESPPEESPPLEEYYRSFEG